MKINEVLKPTEHTNALQDLHALSLALTSVISNFSSKPHVEPFIEELRQVVAKVEAHDVKHLKDKFRMRAYENTLSSADVNELIKQHTPYNNWRKADPEHNPREEANAIGIQLGTRQGKSFAFARAFNDRNELMYVELICIPGHVKISYYTDRISDTTDWVENDKVGETLAKICE